MSYVKDLHHVIQISLFEFYVVTANELYDVHSSVGDQVGGER